MFDRSCEVTEQENIEEDDHDEDDFIPREKSI